MIVGNLEIRLMADIARLQRDMNAGRQVVSNAAAGMERAASAARAALASIGAGLIGGMGLSQIMRMTDEYTKFTAQLKLGTNSQKEYAQAMEDVKRISTAAQNDIGATGVLYARIIASTREMGVTQAQVAKVTETVNLALAATGAGANESASAMLQLSQAFGSGVLRGEEFNAVYEAAPELLRILAKSMGIPIGQLRKLAEEGKLTSDKLVTAFSDNQVINKLRENVAEIKTFSGAMTVFKNNLTEVIGEQLHASGVVATFTSAILAGAGAIRAMLDVLVTATKVGAAYVALLVIAPPLITATAAAMTRLGHAMAVYAMNVMIGQANTIKFNQTLFGTSVAAGLAAGAITRVGLALNGVFALYLGWQIGKYLNDQFVEVEIAAEVMTGELLKAWEVIKFAFKDAFDAITLTAREGIAFLSRGMAGWFGLVADGMRLIGKTDAAAGVDKFAASVIAATEVQGTYASRSAAARAEMEKNIKVIDLDTDRRSTAALAQRLLVGATDRGTEAVANATAAAAANAAAAKQQADAQQKAYESAVKSAEDFARGMQQERDELGLNEDQVRMLGAARAAALAPTEALRLKIMETALALTLETKAWSDSEAARQAAEDAGTEDSRALLDINARIAATKQEIDLYGAGGAAVTAAEAAKVRALAGSMAISEQYREQLLLQADALDRLGEMQGVKSDLDALFDTGRVETFGEALRNAFGEAGSSMAQLGGALQEYVGKQASAEKDIAAVKLKYGKDDVRATRDIAKIQEQMEKDRIGAYGDIAGAAKGFFKENSTGYKLMEGAEQAFRAIQLANQMQSLYTHLFVTTAKATGTATGQAAETAAVGVGEAARNTLKVPGVFMSFMSALGPWGMAAAGVAIAAVLGGAFSGGGSVDLSAQRQESQGTGTVLGSDDKSESIARALDSIEGASVQGLAISNGMLTSLRNIEAGIGQFASLLVRTTGVTGKFGAGIANRGSADAFGNSSMGVLATGGPIGVALDKITGGWVGKITGSLMGKIFGGKTTVEDTGLTIDPASFTSIINGGLNSMQFADIKKDGGWFGKDKYSTKTEGLGEEGNRQIASVLMSLYETVLQAGTMLGLGADDFAAQLNSFVVDIGMVSLKGLSDDEIEKELSAVFSKVGDELAMFGVDGLGQFQKVGEGYLETLTRVATNYQAVSVVTDSMGMTFGAVGLASVGARERLIDLVGGLDEFTSSADQFLTDFYTDQERADSLRARITPTLDQYGIKTGAEDSLQQFRNVVTGLDLTTEAGARAYASLMQYAPAFKQIADVDKEALEKATDLAKGKRELEIQIMEMLGDKAGALAASRALELAGMDAALRPLQERVYALQDEAAAAQVSASLLSVQAQIYELTGNKAGAAAVLAMQHADALAAMDPALRGATQNLWDLQAAAKAAEQVKTAAAALFTIVDGAYSAMQSVAERQKKALKADIDIRTKAIEKTKSLSDALRGSLDSMSVTGQEAQDRQAAQAQIQSALAIAKSSGILPNADDLKNALSVLGKDSTGLFATQADYLRDFYATRVGIEDLAGITDKALSAEERSLKALEDQVTQYDQMLERTKEQIDIAKGQSTVGLSIDQTLQAVLSALLAAKANPVNAASPAINQAYQSNLGRAPDAAGLEYWQNQAAGGISTDAIIGSIKNSPEAQIQKLYQEVFGRPADAGGLSYWMDRLKGGIDLDAIKQTFVASEEKKLRGFAVGTNYVATDMPAMIHEGERIMPAADNRELMRRLTSPQENSAALSSAVDRLTREVEGLRKEMWDLGYQTAKNTGRTANSLEHIDRVGVEIKEEGTV